MRWRKVLISVAIILILLLIYLLFWPVPIDPAAWTPPQAPELKGVYEPNSRLASLERLGKGAGIGPEDVSIDSQGRIYGGMEDGRIVRFQPDGSNPEVFADAGGRPIGHDFDVAGNLIVAVDQRGLLSIAPDGRINELSTEAAGGVRIGPVRTS